MVQSLQEVRAKQGVIRGRLAAGSFFFVGVRLSREDERSA